MTSGGPPAVPPATRSRVSWRAIAIALVSTIVVFGAIVVVVVNAPGWPEFQAAVPQRADLLVEPARRRRGLLEEHPAVHDRRGR